MRVLVIEDHPVMNRYLGQGLREAGYAVDLASDGEEGLRFAESSPYDAIVLDLMLPKLDGRTLLFRLRRGGDSTPVLVLTARDEVGDRVEALDLGADDYLVKPFALAELLARVRALIRRRYGAAEHVLRVADLEVDTVARRVRRAGRDVALSAREYALLEYLASRAGQVVTRAEIQDHVYDFAAEPGSNVIDVYVGYLRRKLDRGHPLRLIHTRRGQGYLLGESA